jgi:hypothetical protein
VKSTVKVKIAGKSEEGAEKAPKARKSRKSATDEGKISKEEND